ncbi:hypothetical protein [Neobacillus sp. PS2-9]|uniref:hypothetical protein n=1 Tax=Neobacillus sp. PS2-9 TaxID=3070676 RepID=UPI0027DFD19D|nr:hypothetical protein [Neobacillus sp. PS2-9]WML57442.1 hypothetical protein RCG25_21450 [Neobacillus sp. PS2-9]
MWISDYKAFWDSFWAGLFSGTIYSIIVGLIVGYILWRFQKNFEETELKIQSEREISVFSRNLATSLRLPKVIKIQDKAELFLPMNVLDTLEVISKQPIDYWSNHLPIESDQKSRIEQLQKVQTEHSEFIIASNKLDIALTAQLRTIYANPNTYKNEISICLALINSISNEEISKWFPSFNQHSIENFSKIANDNYELSEAISYYTLIKDDYLLPSIETLKPLFI